MRAWIHRSVRRFAAGARRYALLVSLAALLAAWSDLPVAAWWLVDAGQHVADTRTTTMTSDWSPLPMPAGGWHVVQWTLALVAYSTWDAFGVSGLVALQAALVAAAVGALTYLARSTSAPLVAVQSAAVAALASRPLGLDGQTAAMSLAALLLALLLRGRWWLAPLVLCAWSNVHGSVAVGLAMVALAACGLLAPDTKRPTSLDRLLPRVGWLLACGVGAHLNPDPIAYWRTARRLAGSDVVAELAPAWQPLVDRPLLAVALALLVAGAIRGLMLQRAWWRGLPLLLGSTAMTLAAVRHAPWLAIASTPWIGWAMVQEVSAGLNRAYRAALAPVVVVSACAATWAVVERDSVEATTPGYPVALASALKPGSLVYVQAELADPVRLDRGVRTWIDARLERFEEADLVAAALVEAGTERALDRIVCGDAEPPMALILDETAADQLRARVRVRSRERGYVLVTPTRASCTPESSE